MNLHFASMVDDDPSAYPRKRSSVIFLCGCPLKCGFCCRPELLDTSSCGEEPTSFFSRHFAETKPEAVVFAGGEPLMQGNALHELCMILAKQQRVSVKIDTCGYYPDALADLLPFLSYVSLDIKTRLKQNDYAEMTGFEGNPELLLSNVLRSLAFLEKLGSHVFKEFRFTIVEGKNDDAEIAESVAKYVAPYCDRFLVVADDRNNALPIAQACRKHVQNVALRTPQAEEKVF
ncbi:7-carboxy-7-deazaguanine synthase [Candidatus Norongarragalina meridionalis]|nr:7-carboxy-7-deazaguanine synthase [Candidatus Norongarragalina meridionalis]